MKDKESGNGLFNGLLWVYALLFALLTISKCTGDTPPSDIYEASMRARPKINAVIEKEELRRDANHEQPMSKEEAESIASEITMREIRKSNFK